MATPTLACVITLHHFKNIRTKNRKINGSEGRVL